MNCVKSKRYMSLGILFFLYKITIYIKRVSVHIYQVGVARVSDVIVVIL